MPHHAHTPRTVLSASIQGTACKGQVNFPLRVTHCLFIIHIGLNNACCRLSTLFDHIIHHLMVTHHSLQISCHSLAQYIYTITCHICSIDLSYSLHIQSNTTTENIAKMVEASVPGSLYHWSICITVSLKYLYTLCEYTVSFGNSLC